MGNILTKVTLCIAEWMQHEITATNPDELARPVEQSAVRLLKRRRGVPRAPQQRTYFVDRSTQELESLFTTKRPDI